MNQWMQFVDTAAVIGIITAALYYFGWQYYRGYYGSFGIDVQSVNLTTPNIVLAAFEALGQSLIFLAIILSPMKLDMMNLKPNTRLITFAQNSIVVLIFWWISLQLDWLYGWMWVWIVLLLLVSVSVLSVIRFSIPYFYVSGNWALKLSLVWLVIYQLGVISHHYGTTDAVALSSGQAESSTLVSLSMIDTESWFDQKVFVLVAHEGGLMYLTPRYSNDPKRPAVYVIPASQVQAAVLVQYP